jgi:hypothetical protein
MNTVSSTAQVATTPYGDAIYQTYHGAFGLIETTIPFLGHFDIGIHDDMGNVVPANFGQMFAGLHDADQNH